MAANDIKQAIVSRMNAHGLNDLVGASGARRFFSMAAPSWADLPWIAFQRIGGTGIYGGGTGKKAPTAEVMFRIAAKSTSSLESIQQQLLAAFDGDGFPGSHAGVTVDLARVLTDGIDDYDPGSETYFSAMIFEFGWVV